MAVTPVASYPTILKYGTKANYLLIQNKDENVLYFCTDSKEIFKGSTNMTDNFVYVEANGTKPAAANAYAGKIYFITDTGTFEVSDGATWRVISYPIVTTIDANPNNNDDVHVPSAKAVATLVAAAVAGEGVVASVVASQTTEGAIDVTDGAGTTTEVIVPGVVTTPSYDAATRTFTFPISDGDPYVVELGTDIFIDPNANNRYEDGYIYLYLNDGSHKPSQEDTELAIPVTGLITDYFGDDTASIQVDIDNSTHKVTANLRVRANAAGTFTNALKVSSTAGAEGAYVQIREDDATVGSEFTNALKLGNDGLYVDNSAIEADIAALDGNVQALAAATTVWGTF